MKIYHNPGCIKSRETLALLKEQGVKPDIVLYLKTPPTKAELKKILKKLGIKASELVRKKEALYKERFQGKTLTEDEWLDILAENPRLIERPIVVEGERAVIGRPPENILTLLT